MVQGPGDQSPLRFRGYVRAGREISRLYGSLVINFHAERSGWKCHQAENPCPARLRPRPPSGSPRCLRYSSPQDRSLPPVTARPECCEQLLDQLLLISPLTNLFAELGGCLSDCGLGWLRVRALLKQAHQLRRAVIEIALDIILYPLRCWARALRFHLAATNMPANYGAPRKTIPCSRLQHSGRKRILRSRSRHPQSMEQWTADFKTRGESSRQTHTMTPPGESKLPPQRLPQYRSDHQRRQTTRPADQSPSALARRVRRVQVKDHIVIRVGRVTTKAAT